MGKQFINEGEVIFSTGVFLRYDKSVQGNYVVDRFEDSSYIDGHLVENEENNPYIEDENILEIFNDNEL